MRKTSIICAAAFAMVFSFGVISSSLAANTGPAEMTLNSPDQKKPAHFPHKMHQDIMECSVCHHTMTADGKQGPYVAGEEKPCESCHNKDFPNAKLNSFMKVGHERCKGCHKEGYKGKNGPTKCTGCHIKK